MLKRIPACIAFAIMFIVASANGQLSPPDSDDASRIETLVNKAAALVKSKGKAAFAEFRRRGSQWWSGDVYVFAYAPHGTVILNPSLPGARGTRLPRTEGQEGQGFS